MLFNGFMAMIGLFSIATIIFWIVCKLTPEVREDEITEWLYEFLFDIENDEEVCELD